MFCIDDLFCGRIDDVQERGRKVLMFLHAALSFACMDVREEERVVAVFCKFCFFLSLALAGVLFTKSPNQASCLCMSWTFCLD